MLNTAVRILHLQLAAHFLIGLDEAVHWVHIHAFHLVCLKITCEGRQTTVASKQLACKQGDP